MFGDDAMVEQSTDPGDLQGAIDELIARDSRFSELYLRFGPPRLRPRHQDLTDNDREVDDLAFASLVSTVISQQLSGVVADAIFGRVQTLCGGVVTPQRILGSSPEELLACGLSRAKFNAITTLGAAVTNGSLKLEELCMAPNDVVIAEITALKGLGPWSADMFLMFFLGRLDVWPVGDLGVRKGFARLHGSDSIPTPAELLALGDRWRPYRSVAAWYLWRILEIV